MVVKVKGPFTWPQEPIRGPKGDSSSLALLENGELMAESEDLDLQ